MELKKYGIVKLEYKRNLEGSINRIIEYRSSNNIFMNTSNKAPYDVININNIIDESYLKDKNIEYIIDNDEIIPVGIANSNGDNSYIRFYIVNDDGLSVESIINTIEKAILMKLNHMEN